MSEDDWGYFVDPLDSYPDYNQPPPKIVILHRTSNIVSNNILTKIYLNITNYTTIIYLYKIVQLLIPVRIGGWLSSKVW